MNILHLYWYSVAATALIVAFILSVWAFSGGWTKYMQKASDWAEIDPGGAQFSWTVGLFILSTAFCFLGMFGLPLYLMVGLGYLVSMKTRHRNQAREAFSKRK